MKILIIHNAGSKNFISGELEVAQNELNGLKNAGHDVVLHVIYTEDQSLIKTALNIFWSRTSFKLVTKLIEEHQPDIVHFHTVLPLLTVSALAACKKKKVPVVQTLHNFRWLCVEGGLFRKKQYCDLCVKNSGFKGALFGCSKNSRLISLVLFFNNLFYRKKLFHWVDQFIAVSNFVKEKHVQAGFPENKITVNYNSLNLQSDIIPTERKGITFVGRLTPAKGILILKRLFSKVNLPFNIIGTGSDSKFLKKEAPAHVKFWGQVPKEELPAIIAQSQVVLVPVQCGETFSLVVAEAMRAGTPVVCSALGGPQELIEQSLAGLTVEPQNVDAFVQAINQIINNPQTAKQMGDNGRKFVQKNLLMADSINKLIKIYANSK